MSTPTLFGLASAMMTHVAQGRYQQALDICIRLQMKISEKIEEKKDA